MHIENEPVFQKYIARLSNQTSTDCLRKVFVCDFQFMFSDKDSNLFYKRSIIHFIQQIYDGSSSNATKITEICSNKHPPTIVSEGNSLTIALDKVNDRDFAFTFDLKAYYTVIDNGNGFFIFCKHPPMIGFL